MSRARLSRLIAFLCTLFLAEGQQSQEAAQWFAVPSRLPKDVLDLPYFDQFRNGNQLNTAAALSNLEALSDTNLPAAQRLFDIFAWKAFVALNSPATASGQPDGARTIGSIDPTTPLVWEFWQQSARMDRNRFGVRNCPIPLITSRLAGVNYQL